MMVLQRARECIAIDGVPYFYNLDDGIAKSKRMYCSRRSIMFLYKDDSKTSKCRVYLKKTIICIFRILKKQINTKFATLVGTRFTSIVPMIVLRFRGFTYISKWYMTSSFTCVCFSEFENFQHLFTPVN